MFNMYAYFKRERRLDRDNEALWIIKIILVLMKRTPGYVFICTVLYVFSQISMLAAILLPWKLLIFMTGDSYPWMIPEAFHVLAERELVLGLAATSLLAFCVYIVCEILISFVCRRGSAFILKENHKVGLFSGHQNYAAQLYRRFLRAIAAVFTVGVIVACLFYLYSYMFVALITYLFFGVAIVVWKRRGAPWLNLPALPLEMKATIWWGAGFFYAVSWLIAGYWHETLPSLTTAFVSLLLVRQAIVLVFPAYGTYTTFIKERSKVNVLFFSDIPWSPESKTDDGFMALIEPARREIWLSALLKKYNDTSNGVEVVSCRVSNAGKFVSLIISSIDSKPKMSFLVKLFHSSAEEGARHERDILETLIAEPLAPHFCGVSNVEEHSCHVFEWPSQAGWMSAQKRSQQLPEIRKKLLSLELPDELVSRYERSRPHLADRLRSIAWDLLVSISPKASLEGSLQLQRYWPDIRRMARLQPRQVVIPRIHQHLIGQWENNSYICNWTRWRWEPVGAGWPLHTSEAEFQQALDEAEKQRPHLAQVSAKRAGLMTLLYEFERLWRLKKHTEAVKLIAPLYEAAKNSGLIGCPTFSQGACLPRE